MGGEHQEIRIVGIDKEAIKISSDKQSFWTIPFKLSAKVDQAWERKFYDVQQKDANAMKRKTQVGGDFIRVEVSEMDDLQKVLDAVKIEVVRTNALCEEDYQKKEKVRQDLETLQKKQTNATQKFKEASDKLQF